MLHEWDLTLPLLLLLFLHCPSAPLAFNLDIDKVTVYSGPQNSYFGYSVDFYIPDSRTTSVLIGAPKANTSQPEIVEGGAVYNCPFPSGGAVCKRIPFDNTNNRFARVNGTKQALEFKSKQWFGATVRSHKEKVVACAPLYHWRSVKDLSERETVGTCYVAIQNFSSYAEYSPCRNQNADPAGQGYCQAGFSLDFYKNGDIALGGPGSYYWQGQVFSANIADITQGYSFRNIIRNLTGEKKTKVGDSAYDDSYRGYSVAVGEFTGDSVQELVAGIPRGEQNFGYVTIIDSTDMTYVHNFTGDQMASYFGYTVAVSDVNSDGLDDVLVGAPLYMDREIESNPKEVGQVYLYLQQSPLVFKDAQLLKGAEVFGRFGSAIANLGDLNQDGYNDVAIGSPFAGEDRKGKVFIHNGNKNGLNDKPSQVLEGSWASASLPAGFGFTLRGDSDIDKNDYPDLIVGAFGAGKVSVYRARPVVTVDAELLLNPMILNPENRTCLISISDTVELVVTCLTVRVCMDVSGQGIPRHIAMKAELELDWLKQKRAVKRTLFRDGTAYHAFQMIVGKDIGKQCQDFLVYLREEWEFRDKLTPITVNLNYSLDESAFLGNQDLKPILNLYKEAKIQQQAHILVDCGDDNMCIPDLKLSAKSDKKELIIGEENHMLFIINARNDGEGAYEAELQVNIPPEADYVGIERNMEGLKQLNCEYKMENESRMVICDLGNPMVAGTNLSLGLRFVVQRLESADSIKFDLFVKSSNKDNPNSNFVSLEIFITAEARVEIRGVSHPPQIVLPIPNWQPKEKPTEEVEIGPLVQHIYELHNIGPSAVGETHLTVEWPVQNKEEFLLYIFHIETEGPLQCYPSSAINTLNIKPNEPEDTPELAAFLRNSSVSHAVSRRDIAVAEALRHNPIPTKLLNCTNVKCLRITCKVKQLRGAERAVVKIRSRLWAETFLQRDNEYYSLTASVSFEVKKMPYSVQPAKLPAASIAIKTSVIWATPNVSFSIPLWVILLAILLGLLVLAILTVVMWKCGFFDRARPPQEDVTDDTEKLTNKTSEA
ncbi:integrin alpha-8 [Hyla sarda]|uniref:integrin alpha-8 n=1 Tax=Hyla sarda TaxID=327740 RepID=UPI0024C3E882|nr:integrin alpha-8 [Hyla sarda]XP_056375068.1 integrin alpha-8 [Hyla sarda]